MRRITWVLAIALSLFASASTAHHICQGPVERGAVCEDYAEWLERELS